MLGLARVVSVISLFPLLDDCQRRRNRTKQEIGIRQQCSNDFHENPLTRNGGTSESTAWGEYVKCWPTRHLPAEPHFLAWLFGVCRAQRNGPSVMPRPLSRVSFGMGDADRI